MPSSKGKPTNPKLREELKEKIKNQPNSDGGGKGQWSAWKASKLSSEYEKQGGDYENEPGSKNEPKKGTPEPKSDPKKKQESKEESRKAEGETSGEEEKAESNQEKKTSKTKSNGTSKTRGKKAPQEGTRRSARVSAKRSAEGGGSDNKPASTKKQKKTK